MRWLLRTLRTKTSRALIEPVEPRRLLSVSLDVAPGGPAASTAAVMVSLRHGTDDGAGHDAGDDNGGATPGSDDGIGHDAGDDHGGAAPGADDGPLHDAG